MIEKLEKQIVEKIVSDNSKDMFVAMPIDPEYTSEIGSTTWYRKKIHFIISNWKKWKVKCFCEESNGEVMELEKPVCPHCGCYLGMNTYGSTADTVCLVTPKLRRKIQGEAMKIRAESTSNRKLQYDIRVGYQMEEGESKNYPNLMKTYRDDLEYDIKSRIPLVRTYYVREKPDDSCGIDIVRLSTNIYATDDHEIIFEDKYDCYTEIVPGQNIRAYKRTKAKGDENISLFDAFHITRDNVYEDENIVFEGAASMIDFMHCATRFSQRTGFINLLMNYTGNIPENSLFLMYMYLLSEYPVIELLVKMGFYGLIFDLFKDITNCYTRDSIKQRVANLSKLLNQTTKGTAALSIPSYIGQFLNAKNAPIEEYMAWVAINELEPLSKENFDKIVNSEGYLYFNYYGMLKEVPNVMKYGYKFNDVAKYIMKLYMDKSLEKVNLRARHRWETSNITAILDMWKDYLQMCELVGVDAAKFPKNLQAVHDDIQQAKRAIDNSLTDVRLEIIAEQYEDFKTESGTLCVVFPKSVLDFVNEGNEQHNCVAHYANLVSEGRCRIFFIRSKDEPDRSYITAECTPSGLGQLMYRNNQRVGKYTERHLAEAVCKHILSKNWNPSMDKVKERQEARIKQKVGALTNVLPTVN